MKKNLRYLWTITKKVIFHKNVIATVSHLMLCAILFCFSFLLELIIPGSLPFAIYFSIILSLLILSMLDLQISGEKIRHSIGYIALAIMTMLLAALSGIDWIFLNLLANKWHYLLTVEGVVLCIVIALFALNYFNEVEWQNTKKYSPTSEEKMMFG